MNPYFSSLQQPAHQHAVHQPQKTLQPISSACTFSFLARIYMHIYTYLLLWRPLNPSHLLHEESIRLPRPNNLARVHANPTRQILRSALRLFLLDTATHLGSLRKCNNFDNRSPYEPKTGINFRAEPYRNFRGQPRRLKTAESRQRPRDLHQPPGVQANYVARKPGEAYRRMSCSVDCTLGRADCACNHRPSLTESRAETRTRLASLVACDPREWLGLLVYQLRCIYQL
jgi:hypothetical protein